jgi:hypothetical protein
MKKVDQRMAVDHALGICQVMYRLESEATSSSHSRGVG